MNNIVFILLSSLVLNFIQAEGPKTMGQLSTLGHKHKTDKVDWWHSFHGESFLAVYEKYMSPKKDQVRNIVEIGVLGGASLCVWRDYFPNATVHGIDIDPRAKQCEDLSRGIHIHIGDQSDPEFLKTIADKIGRPIDIVIDDGSHVNAFTIISFRELFPYVEKGGLYIVEDLHTTYFKLDSKDKVRSNWPGMNYNKKDVSLDNDRADFLQFVRGLIHSADCGDKELLPGVSLLEYTSGVHAVHYHHRTMVIEKCGE